MTNYVGHDATVVECEELRLKHISPALYQKEPALFETKWWDYRFMHPTLATYFFAHCYMIAMRFHMRRSDDVDKARGWKVHPYKKPKKVMKRDCTAEQWAVFKEANERYKNRDVDFFDTNKAYISGMWKSRQAADQHGVPYDTFCHGAVRHAERQKWKRHPMPNHLSSTTRKESSLGEVVPSMMDGILGYWEEVKSASPMVASIDQYRSESYCRHPYQKAHVLHVINILSQHKCKVAAVSEMIFERHLLDPSWLAGCEQLNDPSLLTKARDFYTETLGDDYEQCRGKTHTENRRSIA